MASRRGLARGRERVAGACPGPASERRDAPLTIRLQEPAGSPMHRDVPLRVDYFSGAVEDRAGRVLACLLGTVDGRSLADRDRKALQEQLEAWLARNASALLIGTRLPEGADDDASEMVFTFRRSVPAAPPPEFEVPGPRAPGGYAAAPAAPAPAASAAPAAAVFPPPGAPAPAEPPAVSSSRNDPTGRRKRT